MSTRAQTFSKLAIKKAVKEVPLMRPEETISDAKKLLVQKISQLEIINYFYVIGDEEKLIGVFFYKGDLSLS